MLNQPDGFTQIVKNLLDPNIRGVYFGENHMLGEVSHEVVRAALHEIGGKQEHTLFLELLPDLGRAYTKGDLTDFFQSSLAQGIDERAQAIYYDLLDRVEIFGLESTETDPITRLIMEARNIDLQKANEIFVKILVIVKEFGLYEGDELESFELHAREHINKDPEAGIIFVGFQVAQLYADSPKRIIIPNKHWADKISDYKVANPEQKIIFIGGAAHVPVLIDAQKDLIDPGVALQAHTPRNTTPLRDIAESDRREVDKIEKYFSVLVSPYTGDKTESPALYEGEEGDCSGIYHMQVQADDLVSSIPQRSKFRP